MFDPQKLQTSIYFFFCGNWFLVLSIVLPSNEDS